MIEAEKLLRRRGVPSRIPPTLVVILGMVSCAQYVGTSMVSLFVVMDLTFQPVQLTRFWMFISWAAWCSPIVGWVSDVFYVNGERRRPLCAVGLVACAALWLTLVYWPLLTDSYLTFVFVMILQSVLQMCVSVPLNAMVVEMCVEVRELTMAGKDSDNDGSMGSIEGLDGAGDTLTEDEASIMVTKLQSDAMLFRTLGSLVGAVLQTVLLLFMTRRMVLGPVAAGLNCVCLLPLAVLPPTAARSGYEAANSFREKFWLVMSTLRQSCGSWRAHPNARAALKQSYRQGLVGFAIVLTFVFVYFSMPDASVIYFSYVATAFSFPAWFVSANMCVGLCGSAVASKLYGVWISRTKMNTRSSFNLFGIGCFCSAAGYLTNMMLATGFSTDTLHIPPSVFVPSDNFLTSTMSRLAFMPVFKVAAERSPKGFEGFVFELFSVATLGGSSVSALVTAQLASTLDITYSNWGNLWVLLIACTAGKLLPICFAVALPEPRNNNNSSSSTIPPSVGGIGGVALPLHLQQEAMGVKEQKEEEEENGGEGNGQKNGTEEGDEG